MKWQPKQLLILVIFSIGTLNSFSQFGNKEINWTADGNATLSIEQGNIVKTDLKNHNETILVKKEQLIPVGMDRPLPLDVYSFSRGYSTLLIFTNTAKVWRYNTRGDYWILELASNKLHQLGKGLPAQTLMFAKISPDGKKAAY
ncbi:MAG: DPP IV N-terminal domain-containing protein, partial [Ginsengibacter sp.]